MTKKVNRRRKRIEERIAKIILNSLALRDRHYAAVEKLKNEESELLRLLRQFDNPVFEDQIVNDAHARHEFERYIDRLEYDVQSADWRQR
jgi:hypothetical protein